MALCSRSLRFRARTLTAQTRAYSTGQAWHSEFAGSVDWSQYTEMPWSSHGKPKAFFNKANKEYRMMSWTKGISGQQLISDPLPVWFSNLVDQHGEKPVLHFGSQGECTYSWLKLQKEVEHLSVGIQERLGLKAGDRLGICLPNNLQWVTAFLACAHIGVIAVNINPALLKHEIERAINHVGVSALFVPSTLKSKSFIDIVEGLVPSIDSISPGDALHSEQTPSLRHVVMIDEEGSPRPSGCWKYSDLLLEPGSITTKPDIDQNTPVNIQFTSGTTGRPKGVTLTHSNILNNAKFVARNMDLTDSDILCLPVPLHHCFGLVLGFLASLSAGGEVIYPSPLFDAEKTLEAVHHHKATALHGVPSMFIAELNHPSFAQYDVSNLRTGIMAGSSCPETLLHRLHNEMNLTQMTVCYGMTETSPVSFQIKARDLNDFRYNTVGNILPHVEAKIVNDEGKIVPSGQSGELLVRGYLVMKGYWNSKEETDEAIEDGWMKTGDLATLDEEGYCRIVGRKKDLIIRGGENVYPREIEEQLYAHPAVKDVSVVGVPDETMGELVGAWIIPKAGHEDTISRESLEEFARQQLAHFKVPSYWFFTDEYPMTGSGKVQKHILREWAIEKLSK